MPNRSSKRPPEASRAAKLDTTAAAGAAELRKPDDGKDPAAVTLGRKGGLKGGKARAAALSKTQRAEIAKKAAAARWKPQRS